MEVTQIGKECHHHCEIYKKVGMCVMPTEGIFVKVLKGGTIHPAAVGAAEQGVRSLGCKFLSAALASQREGLTDSVFSSLDFLIPLPRFCAQ